MSRENCQFSYKLEILTPNLLNKALELMRNVFIKEELVCRALNFSQYPEAVDEFLQIPKEVAKDGISIIAINEENEEAIAVAFNKIHVRNDNFYQNFLKKFRHPISKAYMQYVIESDKRCDFFEICQVQAIFDLMFACTAPEYMNKGISHDLGFTTLKLSEKLAKSNVVSCLGVEIVVKNKPQVLVAVLTSKNLQKVTAQIAKVAGRFGFEDFKIGGETLADLVDDKTAKEVFYYRRLEY